MADRTNEQKAADVAVMDALLVKLEAALSTAPPYVQAATLNFLLAERIIQATRGDMSGVGRALQNFADMVLAHRSAHLKSAAHPPTELIVVPRPGSQH